MTLSRSAAVQRVLRSVVIPALGSLITAGSLMIGPVAEASDAFVIADPQNDPPPPGQPRPVGSRRAPRRHPPTPGSTVAPGRPPPREGAGTDRPGPAPRDLNKSLNRAVTPDFVDDEAARETRANARRHDRQSGVAGTGCAGAGSVRRRGPA